MEVCSLLMKPQTRCGGAHQGGKSIGCMGYARPPSQQHTRQDCDLLECRQVISRWQASVQALSIQRMTTKDLSFYRLLEVIFILTTFAPHTSYSHFYASRSSRRRKISSLLHINLFTNQFTTIDPVAWWSKDLILQLRAPSSYR